MAQNLLSPGWQITSTDKSLIQILIRTHLMKKIFTLSLMLICALAVHAQLLVDPTFNPTDNGGGKHNGVFGGEWAVQQSLILPNGKILVGGFYGLMHNKTNQGVSLLNADGSIDPSFNAPGINDDLSDGVTSMALQTDGKIIIGGYMQVYHGQNVHSLVRINPDGNLDADFNAGTGFENYYSLIRSIVVQPDGKIIIGGSFAKYDGTDVNGLIRINQNGSLDESFTFSSDSVTEIRKVKVLSNGKLLIGGNFKIHSDNSYKNLAILNTDGSVDTDFKLNNDILGKSVTAFDVQTDNKIVFAYDSSVYRVGMDGIIDPSFIKGTLGNGFQGGYYSTRAYDIKAQSNGKALICGAFTSYNGASKNGILRLNINGTIDNSFSSDRGFGGSNYGGTIDNTVNSISLFADGRIFIAGGFLFYNGIWQGTMAVLNNDGSVNASFNADDGKGADANVNKIAVQPDKKILIAGYFSAYNGVNRNKIARLNIDGTLDNSFNPGSGPDSSNILNTIVLQKDGKILAGGNFAHFNNTLKSYIVRLNADGSLDNSFNFTLFKKKYGDVSDGVKAIAIQNDGRIVLGFETVDNYITNEYKPNVFRLNADGSLDNSFNASMFKSNTYYNIYSIKIQNDGKILVVGTFTVYVNGKEINNLIRLNTDGSFDETFNAGGTGPNGRIYSISLQSDGKIIIAGRFTSFNNTVANSLARLNVDGILDVSYSPSIPDNNLSYPNAIVDSNDKVIFRYFNGSGDIYSRILRYNTDGSTDTEFGTENKTDFLVSDMALQDNKLLLGGFIESFNGIKRNRITRITTPEVLPVTWVSVKAALQNVNDVEISWQTTDELNVKNYTVQKSINGVSFSNLTIMMPGKGFSNKDYVYTDVNGALAANKIYYRILESDKDGKTSYSRTVFVTVENEGVSLQLYPNPVQNILHVKNLDVDVTSTISIINAEGKILSSLQTASGNCDINTSHLAPGMYYLKISSGNDNYKYKFIKQ